MKRLMRRLTIAVIALAVSLGAYAQQKDAIFTTYEEARQALIRKSVPDVKSAATHIAVAAQGQPNIAALAAKLGSASDVTSERAAFAKLSDEVIKYRATRSGDKPVVAYCPMEKASWLQPAGDVGNPYVDAAMRTCGEIRK